MGRTPEAALTHNARDMSLTRVPLIFTAATWLYIASTPPNAPPPEVERVRVSGVEALLTRVVRAIPYISKVPPAITF